MRLTTLALIALAAIANSAAATAAPRVTGVQRFSKISDVRGPRQQADVECPPGKVVLGGGAFVGGEFTNAVRLTQVEPYRRWKYPRGIVHGYAVTATETSPGTNANWHVTAHVVCSDRVPGHRIVPKSTDLSTLPLQTAAAVCPSGQRALGSGAKISSVDGFHNVGLQVARASGSGDITRAQARVAPEGEADVWRVHAYAVCADTPQGYEVKYGESEERASETFKSARALCPGNKQMLGMGGAVSNIAPGNVTLKSIHSAGGYALAIAVENTPTPASWDFIVAQAICAD